VFSLKILINTLTLIIYNAVQIKNIKKTTVKTLFVATTKIAAVEYFKQLLFGKLLFIKFLIEKVYKHLPRVTIFLKKFG